MRLASATLLALATAGCLAPLTEPFRAVEVELPELRVGDWWRYRMLSDVYAAGGEVTLVVANVTDDGFVFGFPADEDATFPLLQHLPAIGPVRDDLSWDVHEERFRPLRFPLEDGAEWDTTWISRTVHLRAKLENGLWNVTNDGHEEEALARYDIVYDPAVGAFSRFVRTGLDGRVRAGIELVANGTGHAGDVRAIGPISVLMLESRTNGTLAGGGPAVPNPRFTPPEGIDTLLVGCLAGGSPGRYHAEVRSPTGVVCSVDATVAPGALNVDAQIVEAELEAGAWEARLAAVGQGSSTAEVLGYTTSIVSLPGPSPTTP